MEGLHTEYGEMVDAMDPFDFEDLIANLAMAMGFDNVRKTTRTGDKGVDVLVTLSKPWVELEIGMQAKHQKGRVSRTVMDRLRGVMPFFDVQYGIVVTNSYFSKKSFDYQFVRGARPVYLVDRDRLLQALIEFRVWVMRDDDKGNDIIDREAWNEKYGGDNIREVTPSLLIPQANSLSVMLKAFDGVQNGFISSKEIGEYIGYTKRQGHYYRTALQALGFIEVYGNKVEVSDMGNEYISSNDITKRALLRRAVLSHPLIRNVTEYIEEMGGPTTKDMIGRYISEKTSLNATTARRRASTIVAWLQQVDYLRKGKRGYHQSMTKDNRLL